MYLTRDELISRGQAAERLLGNQDFLMFFGDLPRVLAEDILQTAPHEGAKRENLYNLTRLTTEFYALLTQAQMAAEQQLLNEQQEID